MTVQNRFRDTLGQVTELAHWQLQCHSWEKETFYATFLAQWTQYFKRFRETIMLAQSKGFKSIVNYDDSLLHLLQSDLKNLKNFRRRSDPLWPIEQLYVFPHYHAESDPTCILAVKVYFEELILKISGQNITNLEERFGKNSCRFLREFNKIAEENSQSSSSYFDTWSDEQQKVCTTVLKATNANFLMALIEISEATQDEMIAHA